MNSDHRDSQAAESLATLLNEPWSDSSGAITPPIVQSSLFQFETYEDFEDRMAGRTQAPLYSRVHNPTVAAFESAMANAEGGEAAVGFASGMGAIASTLLALVKPGDRIACVEHVYPDAYRRMGENGALSTDARVELIDGEIIDMPPVGAPHGGIVDRLNERFVLGAHQRAIVRVQGSFELSRCPICTSHCTRCSDVT